MNACGSVSCVSSKLAVFFGSVSVSSFFCYICEMSVCVWS